MWGCGNADVKLNESIAALNTVKEPHVNYGYNIIVAVDLSNRIKDDRKYDDPTVIRLITDNLKAVFQKGVDVGISGKFLLTTINPEDFKAEKYEHEVFRIDLTKFGTQAAERSDYIHRDIKNKSLKRDIEALNTTFTRFYQNKKTVRNWLPADMWYFFQDKLTFPLLDTLSVRYVYNKAPFVNKYSNYVIIITDGYIEAGRYGNDPNMKAKNKLRYLSSESVDQFRNSYNNSRLTINECFQRNGYGIMPVSNPLLKDCKILVLEMFDRSVVRGNSTKTPKDMEILKLFWSDWLIKSGVQPSKLDVKATMDNPQDVNTVIKQFLELK